ncbi:MAG: hypothetical protein J1F66_03855 [Clostridiales bacterium]|nr:hypothetical protein [Clostridiales bacterium]
MKVKVYAKLNLTLNVGETLGEFHLIDSVATSVDIYDVVEVMTRTDKQVYVSGVQSVEQERNTAYRAARAFAEAFDVNGVDVRIEKGIPFCGGLGGSSADAAAVLYCLCKLQKIDLGCEKLQKICENIGSDVTFMLHGGLGRLRGKGDTVEFKTLKNPLYFALTTFEQEMSSREVYASFDSVVKKSNVKHLQPFNSENNEKLLYLLEQGANRQALTYFSNDLQQAAINISVYAEAYLQFTQANSLNAVMTGSGSAYYVAFTNCAEAQEAVSLLNSSGFNTILCQSVSQGIEIIDF